MLHPPVSLLSSLSSSSKYFHSFPLYVFSFSALSFLFVFSLSLSFTLRSYSPYSLVFFFLSTSLTHAFPLLLYFLPIFMCTSIYFLFPASVFLLPFLLRSAPSLPHFSHPSIHFLLLFIPTTLTSHRQEGAVATPKKTSTQKGTRFCQDSKYRRLAAEGEEKTQRIAGREGGGRE